MPTPLLLILAAAALGASTALIGGALAHFPPWTLAALRAALALPLLLVLAGAAGRQKRPDRHDLFTVLVGGTLVVSIPFVSLAVGLQHIPTGLGGMLLATMPLFTLALAPMFQRDEPAHLDQGLRIGIGMLGVALMAIPGLLGLGFAQAGTGILLTLLAPLSYAAGNIWFRRRRRMAPLMLSAAIFAVATVTLWPLALVIDGPVAIADPGAALPLLLGLVLGGTLAPLLLNFVMLERGATREAALAMLLMPFFSLGFGVYFLSETLSVLGLGGLALVIAGATARVQGARRARAALPAEVQGLVRAADRAPEAASAAPARRASAMPEPAAPAGPSAEERAAQRAQRLAERQVRRQAEKQALRQAARRGDQQPEARLEHPAAGEAGPVSAQSPVPPTAEPVEGSAAPLPQDQPLSVAERRARRDARRAARQAGKEALQSN